MRRILGDPDQATLRGVFSHQFNRPRMDAFTGLFNGNPGGTAPGGANRSTAAGAYPLVLPGESPRCSSARPRGSGRRRSCRRRATQSRRPSRVATTSACSTQHHYALHAVLVARLPALARQGHGGRAPLRRQPQQRTPGRRRTGTREHLRERFLDEFKLAQANLALQRRRRTVAARSPTRGPSKHLAAADLPRVLQRRAGRAGGRRGALYVDQLHECDAHRELDRYLPNPLGAAAASGRHDAASARTRRRLVSPRTSSC